MLTALDTEWRPKQAQVGPHQGQQRSENCRVKGCQSGENDCEECVEIISRILLEENKMMQAQIRSLRDENEKMQFENEELRDEIERLRCANDSL